MGVYMPGLEHTTIKHYLIEEYLARGGMSEIYLALDTYTQRTVAIKLVHCGAGDDYERFRREVAINANLAHDHILPAFDHGEYASWYYMVTPYIGSGTLTQRLAR